MFHLLVLKGSGDFRIFSVKSGKVVQTEESESSEAVSSGQEISVTQGSEVQSEAETVATVSIYICGEVMNPGIYEAPQGVMLNDIIEEAGGLTEEASVNNINLVYRITTDISIYIPSVNEIEGGIEGNDIIRQDGAYVWGSSSTSSSSSQTGGKSGSNQVNINTASEDELKTLPGIGAVTAEAIIEYRASTPFQAIEDIKNVSGIGESKFSRIKDYICV